MSDNKNYWLKSGILNIFQNSISVILGFLSFFLLVRILTKEEYGTWVLFLSVVGIIELARNGLTQEAVVKYMASANMLDKRLITTATFVINFVMTVVIILLILIIAPWLSKAWNAPEISHMLHLYIIVFVLSGLLNQLNCIERASLNFVGNFYSNAARQVVIFAYVLYCFISSAKTNVILLTYVQILSIAIATLIAFWYTKSKVKYALKIDIPWLKKILHFGKYTFGVSLTSVLANSIDQMMLGSLLSKTASGVFNIAVRITNLTDIPTTAVATTVYPQSSLQIATSGNEAAKYMYEKSVGVILSILVPIVLFIYIFSGYIIPLIASQKYIDAIPLLRITLISSLFSPYGLQAGTILTSAGRTKFNFYLVVFNAFMIIVLNFILIKQFGIMGAAYSSLIVSILGFIICQFYLKKIYGVNALNPWIYAYKFYPEFYNKYILKKGSQINN